MIEKVYEFEQYFPRLYEKLLQLYENEWGYIRLILKEGVKQKVFTNVNEELFPEQGIYHF